MAGAGEARFEVEDVTYLTVAGKSLLARIWKPAGPGPFPIMIDLHGGAWCNQDRTTNTVLSEAMASAGIVVIALDFRMPPDAAYPGSIQDIHFAVRWARANAATWNARADRIGLIGISSGGHQAMLLGLRPNDERYGVHTAADVPRGSAEVQAVVLCWPVIDPIGRYRYGKAAIAGGKLAEFPAQLPNVIPSHDKYWLTEAAMEEGSPPAILERGERVAMPPVLCVQGDADRMHPRDQLERFTQLYRARGGRIDVEIYPGEVEGFVTRQAKDEANKRAGTARIIDFVKTQLA